MAPHVEEESTLSGKGLTHFTPKTQNVKNPLWKQVI